MRLTFEVMLKNEFPEVKLLVLITLEYDTTLYSDNLGQIACGELVLIYTTMSSAQTSSFLIGVSSLRESEQLFICVPRSCFLCELSIYFFR